MRHVTWFCALCCLACFGILPTAEAVNLIANGDFEAGNTGFSSSYTYRELPDILDGANGTQYAIGSDPADHHWKFASYADHTSGSGLMMVVNGSTTSNVTLWEQTVSVAPNTQYDFSIWMSTCLYDDPAHPSGYLAQLDFIINGTSIGSAFAPDQEAVWQNYSQTWQSGLNTMANIKIVDLSISGDENDFAIDDISFVPEPATISLLLLGGFAALRKRKA